MSTELEKRKLPTLAELTSESLITERENQLMVLLNQPPPEKWLSFHPIAKIKNKQNQDVPMPYLPIERVEFLLSAIYGRWWVEVRSVQCIANSTVVSVRLYVVNPITGQTEWNDGVGACPIQTDKGAGAMDWNHAKSTGVQISVPAAETYAIKDAAEKFGKMFGKDLARKEAISYESLLRQDLSGTIYADLVELFELKKEALNKTELKRAEQIISTKEKESYKSLITLLQSK